MVAGGLLLLALGQPFWRPTFDRQWAAEMQLRWVEVDPLVTGEPVNINRADAHVLLLLPGVGPTLAASIVKHRRARGAFRSVQSLKNVRGIGVTKQRQLSGFVTVGEPLLMKRSSGVPQGPLPVEINTANVWALERLPGVGVVLAERIVTFRKRHGPFTSPADLTRVNGIGERKLAKLKQHVRVVASVEPF